MLGGRPGAPFDGSYSGNNLRPGFRERQGYESVSTPPITARAQSVSFMYKPDSKWTWSFLGIALVQAVIIMALEAYAFAQFEISLRDVYVPPENIAYTRSVPVALTVYLFGMIYFLALVWDALRMRNTIQVVGLCLANLSLMIYGAAVPRQIADAVNKLGLDRIHPEVYKDLIPVEIVIPIVLFCGTLIMSYIAYKLYGEFSWSIYKHISADLRMKRRYLTYQIYISLMKFDFFFFLAFAIQLLVVVVSSRGDSEFWLTVAAIPIIIFILLLSGYWVRRENKVGMCFVLLLYLAGLVYFIFKLVRIWSGDKVGDYAPVSKELTIFAVITILLIVGTIVNAIQCMMNFGKGLKPFLLSRRRVGEEEKSYNTEMPNLPHAQAPTRMTID